MPSDIKIGRLPLLPLLGLVLAVLTVVGALAAQASQASANNWVAHTLSVEVKIAEVLERTRAIESGHRGYLIAGNPAYRDDMEQAIAQLNAQVEELARLTADNPRQGASIAHLKRLVENKRKFAQAGAALVAAGHRSDAIGQVDLGNGQRLMSAIEGRLRQMAAEEDRLLAIRSARAQRIVTLVGLGQVASLLLVLAAAWLVLRDARRRYTVMVDARD